MLSQDALDQLFNHARSSLAWQNKPVPDTVLKAIYDHAKLGPTANNTQPMRLVFVKSDKAKQRLLPHINKGNVEKCQAAPVIAILAYDREFFKTLPDGAGDWFATRDNTEFLMRNASLGAAYFIMAARALGLGVRPMSGIKAEGINAEFFTGTSWEVNFISTLGYPDFSQMPARSPRLEFDEACKIL